MILKGKEIEASEVLGETQEQELAMILIPMSTYQVILAQARKDQIGVSEVFERALIGYINNKKERANACAVAKPKPDFILKRGK